MEGAEDGHRHKQNTTMQAIEVCPAPGISIKFEPDFVWIGGSTKKDANGSVNGFMQDVKGLFFLLM